MGTFAGSYGKTTFTCKKLTNHIPKSLYHSAFPPTMNESFCFPTSLSAFGIVSVWDLATGVYQCLMVKFAIP